MGRGHTRRATHRTFKGPTQMRGDTSGGVRSGGVSHTVGRKTLTSGPSHTGPQKGELTQVGTRENSQPPPTPNPADVSVAWDIDS